VSSSSGRGRLAQLAPLAITILLQGAIVAELLVVVRDIGHTDRTLSAVAAYQGSTDRPQGKLQQLDALHGQLTRANSQLSLVSVDRLPSMDAHIVQLLTSMGRLEDHLRAVASELTPGGRLAEDVHGTSTNVSRLDADLGAVLDAMTALEKEVEPVAPMAADVHRVGSLMGDLDMQVLALVGLTRDLDTHVASIDRKIPTVPLP